MIIGLFLAAVTLGVQVVRPEYNRIVYAITCIYLMVGLLSTAVTCIREKLSIKEYRPFIGIICLFLISELPVIYVYKAADVTMQQGVSHYIQAITIILLIGLVSMIIANKFGNKEQ